jgi:hypothetical protein
MDAPCQTNADQPQHLAFNSSVPNQPTYCNISGSNVHRKHVRSGGSDSLLATSSHRNHGSQSTGWLNKARWLSQHPSITCTRSTTTDHKILLLKTQTSFTRLGKASSCTGTKECSTSDGVCSFIVTHTNQSVIGLGDQH